jgi:hypothetical protein
MPRPLSETNQLLGYAPDARLLVLNADDFGMCHAVNAGICGVHSRRAWAFELTVRLAHEYGLAVRADPSPFADTLRQHGYPLLDHPLLDSYDLPVAGKAERYAQLLRALPVGVSEWAVHPGVGNTELQAAMPSWEVRQSDLTFVTSPEARRIISEEGIILLDYRAFQEAWRAAQQRQRG